MVAGGMRLLARSQNEAPFACLAKAVVQQDIEIKSAVMQVRRKLSIGKFFTNHVHFWCALRFSRCSRLHRLLSGFAWVPV
jgi:3-methyladenine DNA glycosylase/8-oxoguanine DNA glycosylase